jgi:hypothetical protein
MRRRLRNVSLTLLVGSALFVVSAIPTTVGPLGSQTAQAQGNSDGGNNGNGGGNNDGGNGGGNDAGDRGNNGGGNGGGGGGSANANADAAGGNSHASSAPGHNKSTDAVASAVNPATAGTPSAVVRQYVIEQGLKQGDVAKLLKSWNSLNRNPQAFAHNATNLNSLAGLQLAYIRDMSAASEAANVAADALADYTTALTTFTGAGGVIADPPTEADLVASSEAILAGELLVPGTYTAEELASATEAYGGAFTGDATQAQAVVDAFATTYGSSDPLAVVALYTAWSGYQTAEATALAAEATAEQAFIAASVSYRGVTDPATLDALRALVDDIIATQGLDVMVTNF